MYLLTLTLLTLLPSLTFSLVISPQDPYLVYSGRWRVTDEGHKEADWPCTSIKFRVNSLTNKTSVDFIWSSVRVHLNVTVWNEQGGDITSLVLEGPVWKEQDVTSRLDFINPGKYLVIIRKLTCATPYGMGIGSKLIKESALTFKRLILSSGLELTKVDSPKRRIEFIGASDTQG